MVFTRICLIGATGNLGKHVLRHLQQSVSPKYEITILTRNDSNNSSSVPTESLGGNIKITKISNYANHAELVHALAGIEVIISALNSVAAINVDVQLLEAGREAGVRRIFPSEYTLDVLHPAAVQFMGEDHPRVVHARRFFDTLIENEKEGEDGAISATTMVSGMFLDLAMQDFDVRNKKAMLIDGGDVVATGSSSDFIAACLVATLKMPEDETRNKRIRIAEVKYTARQILGALEEVTRQNFSVVDVPNQVAKEGYQAARKQKLIRETFVLPVGILNFSAVDDDHTPCGAGLLEDGLVWNAGSFLTYKRKSLLEIAKQALV
jgi:uncharacterized protein YbjT (DUF2867 family)